MIVFLMRQLRRYLKYLTKKFLKKHNVRDWLRVIASNKDRRCADSPPLHLVGVKRDVALTAALEFVVRYVPNPNTRVSLSQRVRTAVLQHRGQ